MLGKNHGNKRKKPWQFIDTYLSWESCKSKSYPLDAEAETKIGSTGLHLISKTLQETNIMNINHRHETFIVSLAWVIEISILWEFSSGVKITNNSLCINIPRLNASISSANKKLWPRLTIYNKTLKYSQIAIKHPFAKKEGKKSTDAQTHKYYN